MKQLVSALAASMVVATLAIPAAIGAEDMREHFMSNWDRDSDGKVILAEVRERRESVFAAFDADENGLLDDDELKLMDEMRDNEQASMGAGGGQGHGMGQGKGHGQGMGQGKGHGQGMGTGKGRSMGWFFQAEQGMHNRGMIDANGDGQIGKAEFIDFSNVWFTRMDRNGDGAIDAADFG